MAFILEQFGVFFFFCTTVWLLSPLVSHQCLSLKLIGQKKYKFLISRIQSDLLQAIDNIQTFSTVNWPDINTTEQNHSTASDLEAQLTYF